MPDRPTPPHASDDAGVERAALRERIQRQIDRQPHFDEYMYVDTVETALLVFLEMVEEQEYATDPHEWCHMRPTYLRALLALSALGPPADDALREQVEQFDRLAKDGRAAADRTQRQYGDLLVRNNALREALVECRDAAKALVELCWPAAPIAPPKSRVVAFVNDLYAAIAEADAALTSGATPSADTPEDGA